MPEYNHKMVESKVASRCPSLCMRKSLKLPNLFEAVFFTDRVIQEKGLYVYNMHNIVEKHLSSLHPCKAGAGR
jgi:hypothetical protein